MKQKQHAGVAEAFSAINSPNPLLKLEACRQVLEWSQGHSLTGPLKSHAGFLYTPLSVSLE